MSEIIVDDFKINKLKDMKKIEIYREKIRGENKVIVDIDNDVTIIDSPYASYVSGMRREKSPYSFHRDNGKVFFSVYETSNEVYIDFSSGEVEEIMTSGEVEITEDCEIYIGSRSLFKIECNF